MASDLSLSIGTVCFDRAVLLTEGEERPLRPLELKLLAYMRDHPDVVLSPATLLREVWGYAAGVETRTLYATINRLRLTLERDPHHPAHILTVPRLGYRFQAAPPAPAPHMPRATNRFVGRNAERTRLRELLRPGRNVTVRGPAGVGKSRLALEVVQDLSPGAPRIVWCNLADARSAEDVTQGLALAFGLGALPRGSGAAVIAALKAHPCAVVVLDNADRILPDVAALARAWHAEASLCVLVTSRSAVEAEGESLFNLDPLDAGSSGGDGFELLDARIRERMPELALRASDPWVTALIGALGGLPLAIELAAPWLAVMSGPELLDHVRADMPGLAGPRARTDAGRHQSLRDSLAWSWPLLDATEREVLAQCAAFEGSFDLPSARGVVEPGGEPGSAPLHEILLSLVERSWLRIDVRAYGRSFSFYAGQRAFIREQSPPDALARAAERHRAYHAGLAAAEDVESTYLRGGATWQRLRDRALDLRVTFRHAQAAGETDRAALIALTLGRILLAEGPLSECLAILDAALSGPPPLPLALHRYRATALRNLGRADEARAVLVEALARPEAAAHPLERARLHRGLGVLEMYQGDPKAARAHLEAAREGTRVAGARVEGAVMEAELGTLEFLHGDMARAAELLERAVATLRADEPGWVQAVYLVNLGVVELIRGEVESAARHLHEALTLHRACGTLRYEALALGNLALVEERRGAWPAAHAHLDAAFQLAHATGDLAEEATLWSNRGLVRLAEGDPSGAGAALERAHTLAVALSIPRLEAEVAIRRARVRLHTGETQAASRLLDRAAEIVERLELPTERRELDRVRAELERHRRAGSLSRSEDPDVEPTHQR